MSTDIEISVADGVQIIRFLRADKKNAFTGAMYNAMSEALDAAENKRGHRRARLHRLGRRVSAGNDINDFLRRAEAAGDSEGRASPRLRSISSAACQR